MPLFLKSPRGPSRWVTQFDDEKAHVPTGPGATKSAVLAAPDSIVSDFRAILSGFNWNGTNGTDDHTPNEVIGVSSFLTFSFATEPTIEEYDPLGFTTPSENFQRLARIALETWAGISGVAFFEAPSGQGDIEFSVYAEVGGANAAYPSGVLSESGFNVSASDFAGRAAFDDSFEAVPDLGLLWTLLHEIGHALGLKHPFDPVITLPPELQNSQYTVLSYALLNFTGELGLFDIQAIQHLYGDNANDATHVSSWNWDATAFILTQTGFSGSDRIHGVAARDVLSGLGGNDELGGWGGDDLIDGGEGNDQIWGGSGADRLMGGNGDDILAGGAGADEIDGGDGIDTADYSDTFYVIRAVDLAAPGGLTGDAAGERLISIENIIGGDFFDTLQGDDTNNLIWGLGRADTLGGRGGDDVLNGGAGADALDGGTGADTASYAGAGAGVSADLTAPASNTGEAAGDTYVSVENLEGSDKADTLRGDAVANVLSGGAGDDVLFGMAGNDTLNGGASADQLVGGADNDTYVVDTDFDIITELAGEGTDSVNASATYFLFNNVENLTLTGTTAIDGSGNALANVINGNAAANQLFGFAGDDMLIGGGGADMMGGGGGIDTASYAASNAGVTINLNPTTGAGSGGDAEGDTLVSIENITGSAFNDTLTGRDFFANALSGGDGDDVLSGGTGGADVMNGGNGIDTLDYSLSPNGVDVRLFSGAASGGAANGDTYSSIENLIGSTKTDTLAGDANANMIWGGGGNETITGREGSDTLHGEAGNDTLLGGADSDTLIGGVGGDTLGGGSQDDLVDYSASNAGVTVNLQTGLGIGGHAQGDVFVSIEDVTGSDFDDVIVGKNNVWDNVFDGRGGNDTYTGGLGNDVFVFRAASGADTVTDFSAAAASSNDTVQLIGFGATFDTFAEVIAAASQVGAHTMIDFGGGQTLTLQNTLLASFTSNDFIFGP